ncbi:response regulator [Rhodospirillaceae bacterium SYSU D60014]|uniref:response regulator n=1 Tax=Virgifigura deserti TaxID=2268457 RepID=UPI000E65F2CF
MSEPLSADGLKILVVEDETIISFLIEDMLQELGCAVVWHAGDVREALALLRDRRPDVAVLDVNLGRELAYPIAAQLDAARIPFIFATGYGRDGIPDEWASRPVIQKPFAIETLAAALDSVLRT